MIRKPALRAAVNPRALPRRRDTSPQNRVGPMKIGGVETPPSPGKNKNFSAAATWLTAAGCNRLTTIAANWRKSAIHLDQNDSITDLFSHAGRAPNPTNDSPPDPIPPLSTSACLT